MSSSKSISKGSTRLPPSLMYNLTIPRLSPRALRMGMPDGRLGIPVSAAVMQQIQRINAEMNLGFEF